MTGQPQSHEVRFPGCLVPDGSHLCNDVRISSTRNNRPVCSVQPNSFHCVSRSDHGSPPRPFPVSLIDISSPVHVLKQQGTDPLYGSQKMRISEGDRWASWLIPPQVVWPCYFSCHHANSQAVGGRSDFPCSGSWFCHCVIQVHLIMRVLLAA